MIPSFPEEEEVGGAILFSGTMPKILYINEYRNIPNKPKARPPLYRLISLWRSFAPFSIAGIAKPRAIESTMTTTKPKREKPLPSVAVNGYRKSISLIKGAKAVE